MLTHHPPPTLLTLLILRSKHKIRKRHKIRPASLQFQKQTDHENIWTSHLSPSGAAAPVSSHNMKRMFVSAGSAAQICDELYSASNIPLSFSMDKLLRVRFTQIKNDVLVSLDKLKNNTLYLTNLLCCTWNVIMANFSYT